MNELARFVNRHPYLFAFIVLPTLVAVPIAIFSPPPPPPPPRDPLLDALDRVVPEPRPKAETASSGWSSY